MSDNKQSRFLTSREVYQRERARSMRLMAALLGKKVRVLRPEDCPERIGGRTARVMEDD